MINITGKEAEFSPDGVIDIQPYVDSIPVIDLEGNECTDMLVEAVYRSSNDKYEKGSSLPLTHVNLDKGQGQTLGSLYSINFYKSLKSSSKGITCSGVSSFVF